MAISYDDITTFGPRTRWQRLQEPDKRKRRETSSSEQKGSPHHAGAGAGQRRGKSAIDRDVRAECSRTISDISRRTYAIGMLGGCAPCREGAFTAPAPPAGSALHRRRTAYSRRHTLTNPTLELYRSKHSTSKNIDNLRT
ncbi:hypothetical protein EVAR_21258_1 [Eumeta japonica]|uniref:Uncharacterized protein n=1 Tax=Eumeta variegata TaxID=151549 RepID=A0A4C1WPU3_EUMVA|nr:hypothetical protein EVAR_21258_1 [Eumeta japonica]